MTTLTTFANRLNARAPNSAIPSLLFVTDETRIPDPLRVISQLPRGTGIILRDYGVQRREDLAASIAVIARRRQLRLLIGSDGDLARHVGAAGLHLPENQSRGAHRWRYTLSELAHHRGCTFGKRTAHRRAGGGRCCIAVTGFSDTIASG